MFKFGLNIRWTTWSLFQHTGIIYHIWFFYHGFAFFTSKLLLQKSVTKPRLYCKLCLKSKLRFQLKYPSNIQRPALCAVRVGTDGECPNNAAMLVVTRYMAEHWPNPIVLRVALPEMTSWPCHAAVAFSYIFFRMRNSQSRSCLNIVLLPKTSRRRVSGYTARGD